MKNMLSVRKFSHDITELNFINVKSPKHKKIVPKASVYKYQFDREYGPIFPLSINAQHLWDLISQAPKDPVNT